MFTCEVDIFQTKIKKKVIFFDFVLARDGWDEDDGKHVKWEMRNEKWKNKYGMQMSSIELKSIESAFLKVFKY